MPPPRLPLRRHGDESYCMLQSHRLLIFIMRFDHSYPTLRDLLPPILGTVEHHLLHG
jgi:hypothetical protein